MNNLNHKIINIKNKKNIKNIYKIFQNMFGLIKGLWDYYFQKPTIKILMVGLDNAGKTVKFK